jgi:oligosaccharide repeat unit polymerase
MMIIAVMVLFTTASIVKYKTIINPVAMVSVWWCGLLWISTLSLTGLNVPSVYTQVSVIILVASYSLGAIVFKSHKVLPLRSSHTEYKIIKRYYVLFKYGLLLLLPVLLYLAIKSYNISQTLEHVSLMRGLSFGDERLWFSKRLLVLYMLVVGPLLTLGIMVGSVLFVKYNSKTILIIAIILAVLDSYIFLGRGVYLKLIFSLVLCYIFFRNQNQQSIKRFLFLCISIAVILISFISVSTKRDILADMFEPYYYYKNAIRYFNVGFVLFDQELLNENSTLNTHYSFGLGTFGGFTKITGIVIRRFIPDFEWLPVKTDKDHFVPKVVGFDVRTRQPIYANAFFTIMYTFYKDFGVLGLLICPFVLGYLSSKYYLLRNDQINSAITYGLIMSIMFFSVQMSQIESFEIWGAFLIIYIVGKNQLFKVNLLPHKTNTKNPWSIIH